MPIPLEARRVAPVTLFPAIVLLMVLVSSGEVRAEASAEGQALSGDRPAPTGVAEADRQYRFAMALTGRGDCDRAAAELRRFAKTFRDDPRAPEVEFWLGYTLHKASKPAEAEKIFAQWLAEHPRHKLADKALFWRAEALAATGRPTRSIRSRGPTSTRATSARRCGASVSCGNVSRTGRASSLAPRAWSASACSALGNIKRRSPSSTGCWRRS